MTNLKISWNNLEIVTLSVLHVQIRFSFFVFLQHWYNIFTSFFLDTIFLHHFPLIKFFFNILLWHNFFNISPRYFFFSTFPLDTIAFQHSSLKYFYNILLLNNTFTTFPLDTIFLQHSPFMFDLITIFWAFFFFFFLSGFSFTNIHHSRDSRGRGRASISLLSTTSTRLTDT